MKVKKQITFVDVNNGEIFEVEENTELFRIIDNGNGLETILSQNVQFTDIVYTYDEDTEKFWKSRRIQ